MKNFTNPIHKKVSPNILGHINFSVLDDVSHFRFQVVTEAQWPKEKCLQYRPVPSITTADDECDTVWKGLHTDHANWRGKESLFSTTSSRVNRSTETIALNFFFDRPVEGCNPWKPSVSKIQNRSTSGSMAQMVVRKSQLGTATVAANNFLIETKVGN